MTPDRAIIYSRDYQLTVASGVYYLDAGEPTNTTIDLAVALQLCQSAQTAGASQTTEVIAPLNSPGVVSATGLMSQAAALRFTTLSGEKPTIYILGPDPLCFIGGVVDDTYGPIADFITFAIANLRTSSGEGFLAYFDGVLAEFLLGFQAVLNACPRAKTFGVVTDFWPQDGAIAKGDNP